MLETSRNFENLLHFNFNYKRYLKSQTKTEYRFYIVDIMRAKIVWSLGDGGPFTGVSYLNEVIDVKTIVKLTPVIFGPGILMIK